MLPMPTDCPSDAYELMLRCWKTQPNQRITMKVANQRLAELCSPKIKNSDSSLYLHVIE